MTNLNISRDSKYLTITPNSDGSAIIWVAGQYGEAEITITPQEVADVIKILAPPVWTDARFIELRPDTEDSYCMARVDDETWVDQYGQTVTETEMFDVFEGVDIRVIA